jgi:hypothetical protein
MVKAIYLNKDNVLLAFLEWKDGSTILDDGFAYHHMFSCKNTVQPIGEYEGLTYSNEEEMRDLVCYMQLEQLQKTS